MDWSISMRVLFQVQRNSRAYTVQLQLHSVRVEQIIPASDGEKATDLDIFGWSTYKMASPQIFSTVHG